LEVASFTGGGPSLSLTWVSPPAPKPDTLAEEKAEMVQLIGLRILSRRFQDAAAGAEPPFTGAAASSDQILRAATLTGISVSYGDGRWEKALKAEEAIRVATLKGGVSQGEVDRAVIEIRARLAQTAAASDTRTSNSVAQMILREAGEGDVYTSATR